MKIYTSIFIILLILPSSLFGGWGFFGHKRINRMAVFTIADDELFNFYKFHLDFITEHAVDPDKRRYAVKVEGPRHFIDIDHYVKKGENPFAIMPRNWKDAVDKFSEDTLQAYGIVPWHIDKMVKRLTYAFKEKNLDRILKYSADLGHYVSDAHVPLHTTENYNGQFTNQKGIHGFWESRIPELYANDYDYLVGKASYIKKPLDKAWNIVEHSFNALDSVLTFEQKLTDQWSKDKKYSYENRGSVMMKVYSKEFSAEYSKRLNGMQERRMRESIISIGSLWLTAWINAGQPDLSSLMKNVSDDYKKEIQDIDNSRRNNKIFGRKHD